MHCRLTAEKVESITATVMASVERLVAHLVAHIEEAGPTLEGLERAVLEELHAVGNVTLGALCDALTPQYAPATSVCACGEEAAYQRRRWAQCKTLLGTIHTRRPYYLCATCHHGHYPLDKELGLCAGGVSAGLEALMALLGAEFSFDHAAGMVAKLSLVQVSATRCREATVALGEWVAEKEEEERQAVWEQGHEPPPPAPEQVGDPLYVSADGVIIHTRESGWREQCVGAVYTTTAIPHPLSHRRPAQAERSASESAILRSQGTSFVSELGSRPDFSQLLWLEAHRRGLEQARRMVFIGDGAHWLWETAHDLFPQAIQILDWYHASSYIWKTAQALYPDREPEKKEWADPHLAALWQSRTAEVIAHLAPLTEGCSAARDAYNYFTFNQSRMDYKHYRSLGLQVGSGTIESACKHVVQARIKQAGMRWNVHNARVMGKLRARLRSNRWDETLALRPLPSRSYHRNSP